jgi:3-hydroxyacyl-[acyl-carrier-protein] dehydratase
MLPANNPANRPSFHHDFDSVAGYLHHRAPYLLIKSVVDLQVDSCRTTADVADLAPLIAGHFPGAPILPGALMQEMTTQTAGVLIAGRHNPMSDYRTDDPDFNPYALGVLVKVKNARFRGFARPGDTLQIRVQLECRVDHVFDFAGQITCRGSTIMKNRFQLANIPTPTLRGQAERPMTPPT